MEINFYRYFISYGKLSCFNFKECKETPKCYWANGRRLLKSDDGVADIKDRTSYPYIDFYSTKDSSREFAVKNIIKFLTEKWGLCV